MAVAVRGLFLVGLVITLFSMAYADAGVASFYDTYVPSACYGSEDQGVMIAAATDSLFQNRAACGRMYRVSCTSGTNAVPNPCRQGSVTVKIVDLCPSGCQGGTLDLSREAFSQIANPDAGRVNIEYSQV